MAQLNLWECMFEPNAGINTYSQLSQTVKSLKDKVPCYLCTFIGESGLSGLNRYNKKPSLFVYKSKRKNFVLC